MVEAAMAAAALAVAQGVEQVEVEEGAMAAAKVVVDFGNATCPAMLPMCPRCAVLESSQSEKLTGKRPSDTKPLSVLDEKGDGEGE